MAADINSTMHFLWPPQNYTTEVSTVPFKYVVDGPHAYVRFSGSKLNGITESPVTEGEITLTEPGSYFATVEALNVHREPVSSPLTLRIERVLPPKPHHAPPRRHSTLFALPNAHLARPQERTLCFVARTTPLDGQKRIWLRLINDLRLHPTTKYYFHVLLMYEPAVSDQLFKALGVDVLHSPFKVTTHTLCGGNIISLDEWVGGKLASDAAQSQLAAFAKASDRSQFPAYIRRLWESYLAVFARCKGGIIVYGNARDHGDPALAL
ncbi:hypothetical protein ACHHYP_20875, partial [Achlya hypogyna]